MNLKQRIKQKRVLYGGISGLVIGFYMIFFVQNKWGFVPMILGSILLIWGKKIDGRK